MRDAVKKGRMGIGGLNGRAKLKEPDVIKILKDHRPSKEICKDYNVTNGTINNLRAGRTWKYLTVPAKVENRIEVMAEVLLDREQYV